MCEIAPIICSAAVGERWPAVTPSIFAPQLLPRNVSSFGMVGVNEWAPQSPEVPFSGWKESGLDGESGAEGLDEYLETKVIGFGGLT